jgi:branched-chain amino acid transport system permease protein
VVVGGLGSLAGAFIASLTIGILQTFMVGWDYSIIDLTRFFGIQLHSTSTLARLSLTQLAPIMPYLLMVAILVFRPRGIMGARES